MGEASAMDPGQNAPYDGQHTGQYVGGGQQWQPKEEIMSEARAMDPGQNAYYDGQQAGQ